MEPSDDQLLRAAVKDDSEALTELLRRHGPGVWRALRIDRAWQAVLEPDDVMQVTYLEAFMRIGCFDPDGSGSFAGWLKRIAENNLRDAIRGLSRQKQPQPKNRIRPAVGQDSLVGLYDLLGVTTSTPSRAVGRNEICQLLEDTINSLPPDYAKVVRLYDVEGEAIGDVASAMGRSSGAVHMLRARAHDRLREQLGSASIFFNSKA